MTHCQPRYLGRTLKLGALKAHSRCAHPTGLTFSVTSRWHVHVQVFKGGWKGAKWRVRVDIGGDVQVEGGGATVDVDVRVLTSTALGDQLGDGSEFRYRSSALRSGVSFVFYASVPPLIFYSHFLPIFIFIIFSPKFFLFSSFNIVFWFPPHSPSHTFFMTNF